jgi:hypothetical protein
MDNIFLIAGFISAIFLVAKFVEMRFIDKDNKPLKLLVRDVLLVYVSVIVGYFVLDQFKPVMQSLQSAPQVFTDNPEF